MSALRLNSVLSCAVETQRAFADVGWSIDLCLPVLLYELCGKASPHSLLFLVLMTVVFLK